MNISKWNLADKAPWLPLAFYWFIGESLASTHGHYNFLQVIEFTVFLALYAWWSFQKTQASRTLTLDPLWIFVGLLFMFQLATRPGLMYVETVDPHIRMNNLILIQTTFLVILGFLALVRKKFGKYFENWDWWLQILFVTAGLSIQVHTLRASPSPNIDVFTTTTAAVDHFLSGHNPYIQTYADIYKGFYGYPATFGYWPGLLLWLAPVRALLGDIRFGFVIANAGIVFLFYLWGARNNFQRIQIGATWVLWLSFPVTLFVLEQAWIDTLLCFQMMLFLFLMHRKKVIMGGLVLGWFMSTKQYAAFAALFALLGLAGWGHYRQARIVFVAALVSFSAIMIPFIYANPEAFYNSTMGVLAGMKPRYDAFTLVALMKNQFGITISGWVTYPVLIASFVYALALLTHQRAWGAWLRASAVFYGVLFLFGKQAFCNYYYFMAFILLLSIVVEVDFQASSTVHK